MRFYKFMRSSLLYYKYSQYMFILYIHLESQVTRLNVFVLIPFIYKPFQLYHANMQLCLSSVVILNNLLLFFVNVNENKMDTKEFIVCVLCVVCVCHSSNNMNETSSLETLQDYLAKRGNIRLLKLSFSSC